MPSCPLMPTPMWAAVEGRDTWGEEGSARSTGDQGRHLPTGTVFLQGTEGQGQRLPWDGARGNLPLLLLAQSPGLTLDHADIVGAVPDGQGHSFLVLLHQLHHLGLLQRRHTAADDGLAGTRRLQELYLHVSLQRMGLQGEQGDAGDTAQS